ncbi:unnamed protein product [Vitrella brassicaformis CCMP3155]|uniref:EF-hand domain-containing protein n=1 Tax=Vitrella brassicaformis (strain CCMP3155) TaxID=1169540 RepID=A0A0G4EAC2_VITBC|nr:unnamed protein product [Vitrella brassicaformis CCMP3155]|eukprot:CEL92425.1 unnamed protein product [Vitrella brassicaformis CCMP3155]
MGGKADSATATPSTPSPPPTPEESLSSESFLSAFDPSKLGQRFQDYGDGLKGVKTVDDWLKLNGRVWGDPVLGSDKFSTGAIFGFVSGFAIRQAFRVAVTMAGLGYISLQTLAYKGYISINWPKIEKDVTDVLDLDKDGQITHKDFQIGAIKLQKFLMFGLPSAAGFGTGFWLGMRGK